jgi:sporulation protein YlmC with PRC-barrel domain
MNYAKLYLAVAAVLFVVGWTAPAQACESEAAMREMAAAMGEPVEEQVAEPAAGEVVEAVKEFTPKLVKGSKLIGIGVQDAKGGAFGRIEQVVFNADQHQVSFGVVSCAAKSSACAHEAAKTAGKNGAAKTARYYAVPWSMLTVSADCKSVTLGVERDRLKGAPSFERANWPDLGDPRVAGEICKFYHEIKSVEACEAGKGELTASADKPRYHVWAPTLTELIGLSVRNGQGVELGQIENVMIDTREGRPVFGVLSYGGTPAEERLVVVPWSAFDVRPGVGYARLDVDRSVLEGLAFKAGDWPDLTDRTYASRLYERFNREPYWEVFGYVGHREIDPLAGWRTDSDYNKLFNAKDVKTFDGTIQSVGVFTPQQGSVQGLRLRVKTADGSWTVHAGPLGYVCNQNVRFYYGDSIKVSGSQATVGGRQVLLGSEIVKGGQTLKLRGSDGLPVWKVEELGDGTAAHGGAHAK